MFPIPAFPKSGKGQIQSGGSLCKARNGAIKISPCGMFPIPAFPKSGKGQIQSGGSLCKARNGAIKISPCGMFPIPAFPKPGKGQIQSGGINPPHGTRAPKGNVKKYEVTYPLKSFIIN